MEEIILNLVCQEYDIEEYKLFSLSREDSIVEPLSLLTHILHFNQGLKIASIHLFYSKKGYPKRRANLYNLLKRSSNKLKRRDYYKDTYDDIVNKAKLANSTGVFVEEDTYLSSIRGRVAYKLFSLKKKENLKKVELILDKCLQTEFIMEGQYD